MRKIFHIAWNDIRIEFSDRATLVFFLILPLVFTTILGQAMGGSAADDGGDDRYPVLILDQDQTNLSTHLVSFLNTSEIVRPVTVPAADAKTAFEQGEALAALTLPAGFEERLLDQQTVELDLQEDLTDSRTPAIERAVQAALDQIEAAVQSAHTSLAEAQARQAFDATSEQAYFDRSLERALDLLQTPATRVEWTEAAGTGPEISEGFDQVSPGQMVTWVLITLLGASEVFVNERLGGTLRRVLTTPTQKATLLLGKISGRLAQGLVQMALLVGFGAWVLGVNWGRSPLALGLVILSFGMAAVALGTFLATVARTRSQASAMTTLFAMLLAALGGAWWPMEITPPLYQTAVKILPTTWAMQGFTDVILRGAGVQQVLPEVGVLLGFAGLFFGLGVMRLKFE